MRYVVCSRLSYEKFLVDLRKVVIGCLNIFRILFTSVGISYAYRWFTEYWQILRFIGVYMLSTCKLIDVLAKIFLFINTEVMAEFFEKFINVFLYADLW